MDRKHGRGRGILTSGSLFCVKNKSCRYTIHPDATSYKGVGFLVLTSRDSVHVETHSAFQSAEPFPIQRSNSHTLANETLNTYSFTPKVSRFCDGKNKVSQWMTHPAGKNFSPFPLKPEPVSTATQGPLFYFTDIGSRWPT